jgi:lipooligosaccharide transport system permease protein
VRGLAAASLRLTPPALLGTGRALRLVERNVAVYRRGWPFFVSGLFEPFFYLLSVGVGLAPLVGRVQAAPGHLVGYAVFLAPGLLATSAMNGTLLDATFNLYYKLKFAHTYDAVLATPVSVADVAVGELAWALLRAGLYATAFVAVMAGLGDAAGPWAALCLPASIAVSFAFGAAGMAATTYMRSWQDFDLVSVALLPLFLFSATFYPLTVYPGWLQAVVACTPLYQGVALLRAIDVGAFSWACLGHLGYLVAMGAAGMAVTVRRMGLLLLP